MGGQDNPIHQCVVQAQKKNMQNRFSKAVQTTEQKKEKTLIGKVGGSVGG